MPSNAPRYSLWVAFTPIVVLISLLSLNVFMFGDEALSGSNQVVLLLAAAVAATLANRFGCSWQTLQEGILDSIMIAVPALLILLLVGALSGTWLLSGVVPTMIYYGLQLLNPTVFLAATCIIGALVALATGSSWTTAATVGIALMGIGQALGLPEGMIAGAIISGAYFGDKMSPLSDTTNLASGVAGTELFTHIRYMAMTTTPSFLIALVLFAAIGFFGDNGNSNVDSSELLKALDSRFNITPWLLLVPAAVIFMVVKKVPAIPAIFIGILLGAVFAFIFQFDLVQEVGSRYGNADLPQEQQNYMGVMYTFYGSVQLATGNEMIDDLLKSKGMSGMLPTIWLILSAMVFGGIMERSGFLTTITGLLIRRVNSDGGLVTATAGTCIFTNVTASDQFLAIVVPGRMFASAYKERGLAEQNLSRSLEDSGTVTSVLVPWNTCGAFHAGVLGVSTFAYAPFAFFCMISPLMTIFFAYRGIRIARF